MRGIGADSLHGIHNCLITGTTAEIPGNCPPDFFFSRMRIFIQQRFRRQDHPRCAEPALNGSVIYKSLLQLT
jgi:hypothetical protein